MLLCALSFPHFVITVVVFAALGRRRHRGDVMMLVMLCSTVWKLCRSCGTPIVCDWVAEAYWAKEPLTTPSLIRR